MKKIKLLIIEENRLLRDGITSMLKGQPDIKVITAAGGNEKSLEKIRQIMPDIILLNLGLRNQNSLTIVEVVKKDFPKARIIVMDLTPDQGDINLFFDAGASGFILKEATLDELLITVRAVADGGNVFPPDLTESLFSQIVERALKGSKAKLAKAVCMT
jgi:DNA-binding NarL/FixJ family response regulator